jgi:hypothetical protein
MNQDQHQPVSEGSEPGKLSETSSKKADMRSAKARRIIEERMEQKRLRELIDDIFLDDLEH